MRIPCYRHFVITLLATNEEVAFMDRIHCTIYPGPLIYGSPDYPNEIHGLGVCIKKKSLSTALEKYIASYIQEFHMSILVSIDPKGFGYPI